MAYIYCKSCGTQMSDKSEACPMCGSPISQMICPDERQTNCPQEKNSYNKWFHTQNSITNATHKTV